MLSRQEKDSGEIFSGLPMASPRSKSSIMDKADIEARQGKKKELK